MFAFQTRLLVSFVNTGGQPLPVQFALKMRAQAMAQRPDVPAEAKRAAQAEAEMAAQPIREVARFQRDVSLPIQPRVDLALRGVGPLQFEPRSIEYDVETGHYTALEVVQLCHATGDCACQKQVSAYMQDARWQMLEVYGARPVKESLDTTPCAACAGNGTALCPDAPGTCRCLPDVLRHKCPTCKGAGRVAKP